MIMVRRDEDKRFFRALPSRTRQDDSTNSIFTHTGEMSLISYSTMGDEPTQCPPAWGEVSRGRKSKNREELFFEKKKLRFYFSGLPLESPRDFDLRYCHCRSVDCRARKRKRNFSHFRSLMQNERAHDSIDIFRHGSNQP